MEKGGILRIPDFLIIRPKHSSGSAGSGIWQQLYAFEASENLLTPENQPFLQRLRDFEVILSDSFDHNGPKKLTSLIAYCLSLILVISPRSLN